MKKLKLGIIGAGNITKAHLDVLACFNEVKFAAITSRTYAKAALIAQEYKIETCFEDIASMFDTVALDGVLVLVSADQIFDVAKAVLPYGVPTFLEKPAGLSLAETTELADLSEKYHVKTMVGYNRRFYSIFKKGQDIIRQHGKLLGVAIEGHERFWKIKDKIRPELRKKWLYANNTHMLDLLHHFGGEIAQLESYSSALLETQGDQFVMSLRFKSGALGQYLAHWYSPGGWSVTLYGEGVTVKFKPLENGVWIDEEFVAHDILMDDIDIKFKPGFYQQMNTFVNILLEKANATSYVTLKDAVKTSALANQLENSLA